MVLISLLKGINSFSSILLSIYYNARSELYYVLEIDVKKVSILLELRRNGGTEVKLVFIKLLYYNSDKAVRPQHRVTGEPKTGVRPRLGGQKGFPAERTFTVGSEGGVES